MPPDPPRRKAGRPANSNSEATKLRVLDAAIEAFAVAGSDGTTSQEIAERAGVTTATVYHHFADKHSLYVAAFQYSMDVVWRRYAEAAEAAAPGGSLAEEMMAIIRCASGVLTTRPAMTLLAMRAHIELGSDELDLTTVKDLERAMVARAIARGELDRADAALIGCVVEMFLWGISVVGRDDARRREQCVEALDRILRNTLVRPASARRAANPVPTTISTLGCVGAEDA